MIESLDDGMSNLSQEYGVPAELEDFVNSGFLQVVCESAAEKTVSFGIPSLDYKDERDNEFFFTLDWIHPNHNAEFCHYYDETPGDLANFILRKECREVGDENIDVETFDDLLAWLADKSERR